MINVWEVSKSTGKYPAVFGESLPAPRLSMCIWGFTINPPTTAYSYCPSISSNTIDGWVPNMARVSYLLPADSYHSGGSMPSLPNI